MIPAAHSFLASAGTTALISFGNVSLLIAGEIVSNGLHRLTVCLDGRVDGATYEILSVIDDARVGSIRTSDEGAARMRSVAVQ